MSAARRAAPLITPEAYVEAERVASVKHEYVGGRIYARDGESADHGHIVANLAGLLGNHLVGGPCYVFIADMRVRAASDVYYYPDLVVACEPVAGTAHEARQPRVVVEVASPSTRRTDEAEKAAAYWRVPSIETYVLVDTEALGVRVMRRGESGWESELLTAPEEALRVEGLGFAAPLADIYARTEALGGG